MCLNHFRRMGTPICDARHLIEETIDEFPNELVKAYLQTIDNLHKIISIESLSIGWAFMKNGNVIDTRGEKEIEPYGDNLFQYKLIYHVQMIIKGNLKQSKRIYLFNE